MAGRDAPGVTERALLLLGLLQQRPVWTASELAEQLGVTERSIRRDVERLRHLGYPVNAARGAGGGYQLGSGTALPPLLLDDDEAIAMAVSLRVAAGGTVAGASEAAVRTLAKLDQVLPSRLRAQVRALHDAIATVEVGERQVDADVLLLLARAARDHLRVGFTYVAHDGERTARRVEPYRLVAAGRRWYLMAFDLDRDDWRTFRLDRLDDAAAGTWRFAPREHPDPAAYVQRSIGVSPYPHRAVVRLEASAETVRAQVPPSAATVEELDATSCVLRSGAGSLEWLALHVAVLGHEFEVLEPPELREVTAQLAARLARGAAARR